MFQQILGNFFVDFQLTGIDDAHVQAGFHGVVQKRAVHRFADAIVAAEAEADVADTAAGFRTGTFLLDATDGIDEIDGVVVVFFDAGRDGQNIRIEDDVFGRKTDFIDQQIVGSFADTNFVVFVGGLSLFVERHHDGRGTILANQAGATEERFFAIFQRDRVDDRFALRVAKARFDDFPLAAVDHHRDRCGNVITGDQPQIAGHRFGAVQQGVIKVDVDDRGAVLNLFASDFDRFFVVFVANQTREFAAAGHVGPFADHREGNFRTHHHRQLPRQPGVDRAGRILVSA